MKREMFEKEERQKVEQLTRISGIVGVIKWEKTF